MLLVSDPSHWVRSLFLGGACLVFFCRFVYSTNCPLGLSVSIYLHLRSSTLAEAVTKWAYLAPGCHLAAQSLSTTGLCVCGWVLGHHACMIPLLSSGLVFVLLSSSPFFQIESTAPPLVKLPKYMVLRYSGQGLEPASSCIVQCIGVS